MNALPLNDFANDKVDLIIGHEGTADELNDPLQALRVKHGLPADRGEFEQYLDTLREARQR